MGHAFRLCLVAGVTAGLIGAAPTLPGTQPSGTQPPEIGLAGTDGAAGATADSALGGGTAYVMGGSTIPVPGQRYLDAVDALFLQPHGFTGTTRSLFTPEGLYPLTGVKSLMLDPSVAQGQQILDATVLRAIERGGADADNPVVVVGWSQSAAISSLTMPRLHDQQIPADDVRFVLVGDPNAPNGGLLERFHVPINGESPTVPALGITFNGSTPPDLYPTTVYTTEYDLFADFPRYPINLLADFNAYLGIIEHARYPVLSPEQVASAIALPTADPDGLTDYYLIPAQQLPLLAPMTLLPFVGQPLYNLLEPVTRILVNLGYGSIEHGWDPGPADVPSPFALFPTDLDFGAVLAALAAAVPQGIQGALDALADPANWNLAALLDNPLLTLLTDLVYTLGFTDATNVADLLDLPTLLDMARNAIGGSTGFPISDASLFSSTPTEIVNALSGTVAGGYAALLPIADTANTLLTTVPAVLTSFVADRLADGDVLGAIGDPIAAALGLVPFSLIFGAGAPAVIAAGGTLVNLAGLIGLGGPGGLGDLGGLGGVDDLGDLGG